MTALLQGFVQQGSGNAITAVNGAYASVGRTYPGATVTIYLSGTPTLATLYADTALTPKANPFVSDANAYWFAYVADGTYDVKFSSGGIAVPFTYTQIVGAGASNYVSGAFTSYGDSITHGYVGSVLDPADAYVNLVAVATAWTSTNLGADSTLLQDSGQIDNILANVITATSRSTLLTGYNDMRWAGTNASQLAAYRTDLAAALVWLAVPETSKTRGTGAITYTGSWSTASVYSAALVKFTQTNGDSASTTVQGTTVYIGGVALNTSGIGGGGTFSVVIDGTNYGTYSCSGVTVSPNGRAYAPFLVRIPNLGNTKHTVTITHNSTTGSNVYLAYIASNANAQTVTGPSVWVGNCLRMNTAGYAAGGTNFSAGSDTATALYNSAIRSVIAQLTADGLNVAFVDMSIYNPDTTDVGNDNIHPSLTGHPKIASAFLRSMSRNANAADHATGIRPLPIYIARAALTSNSVTVSSATPLALSGATTTFVAPFDGLAIVHGDFDVQEVSTGGLFLGDLYVNASALLSSGRIGFDPQTAAARAAQSHTWSFPIAGGTTYVLALYGTNSGGSGSFTVFGSASGNANTGFVTTLFPQP